MMYVSGLTNPNEIHIMMPVAPAIATMEPTGFRYTGCFIARYDIMIAGNAIAMSIPAMVMV